MSLDSRSYRFESSPIPHLAPASVLVAEDDPALRDLVCRRLVDVGFEVHSVASSVELVIELERLSSQAWPATGVDLIISYRALNAAADIPSSAHPFAIQSAAPAGFRRTRPPN